MRNNSKPWTAFRGVGRRLGDLHVGPSSSSKGSGKAPLSPIPDADDSMEECSQNDNTSLVSYPTVQTQPTEDTGIDIYDACQRISCVAASWAMQLPDHRYLRSLHDDIQDLTMTCVSFQSAFHSNTPLLVDIVDITHTYNSLKKNVEAALSDPTPPPAKKSKTNTTAGGTPPRGTPRLTPRRIQSDPPVPTTELDPDSDEDLFE